ncbi:MAG: ParB/RepB/Spo0J family partition protein, partial [candidate division Zixibacteria bacterium]|nr:ParB/RepB/Spo0J family partition protein [candidate division Zixibacteria bacterium]NIT52119.1 ParB/RepB/Spo0J family partition protein [candidate division Zixibacteria bacterium]NIW39728.1 ParB/RepB/Spo0J family partition protein [candidate division Zixibacteria bacterium]NIX56066.1 ParB/RepB/Spo0J family partition protein [candidate division Zixibacteria bacterium]
MNKMKLGKGLSALIPNDIDVSDRKKFIVVETDRITPNPDQPRREFNESSLKDLADSITQNGILQPLLIKSVNGDFQLVAGERRFRAAQMIGLERVPAILVEGLSRMEQMQLALIENLQREDLNVMELAEGYSRMINEYGLTQDDLARKVSKNRSTITNTLRLLNLPDEVKELIRGGKISGGHARTILALNSEREQLEVARKIIDENLSVRVLEELIYG